MGIVDDRDGQRSAEFADRQLAQHLMCCSADIRFPGQLLDIPTFQFGSHFSDFLFDMLAHRLTFMHQHLPHFLQKILGVIVERFRDLALAPPIPVGPLIFLRHHTPRLLIFRNVETINSRSACQRSRSLVDSVFGFGEAAASIS